MIEFVVQWLWYGLAFFAGVVAMTFVLLRVVPARTADEAAHEAYAKATHRELAHDVDLDDEEDVR